MWRSLSVSRTPSVASKTKISMRGGCIWYKNCTICTYDRIDTTVLGLVVINACNAEKFLSFVIQNVIVKAGEG